MEQSKLAKIFKALSNEQRLKLFTMIYYWYKTIEDSEKRSDCCDGVEKAFTKACGCLNIARSTISHHLKELENAGLISCTRSGQMFCVKINKEAVDAVKSFLE